MNRLVPLGFVTTGPMNPGGGGCPVVVPPVIPVAPGPVPVPVVPVPVPPGVPPTSPIWPEHDSANRIGTARSEQNARIELMVASIRNMAG